MKKGVLLFALLAFGLAGGTVFFANKWLKQQRAAVDTRRTVQPESDGTTYVLIAAKAIPSGTFLAPSDVRWIAWPTKEVPQTFIVERGAAPAAVPQSIAGTVVRRGLVAGQPLTNDVIVRPGDRGFLAAVLKPGMRAVSVRVDESTGVSGLVFPGDRVDVIVTYEYREVYIDREGKEVTAQENNRVGETILTGVRVLAIDQSIEDIKGAKAAPKVARTVTLEVLPKQAESIYLAAKIGTLQLSLQSLACTEGQPNTATGDPSPAPGQPPAAAEPGPGPCAGRNSAGLPSDEPDRGGTLTRENEVARGLTGVGKPPHPLSGKGGPVGGANEVTILRGGKSDTVNADDKKGDAPTAPPAPKAPAVPGAKPPSSASLDLED
jgi:pilus assembly protein CpaB